LTDRELERFGAREFSLIPSFNLRFDATRVEALRSTWIGETGRRGSFEIWFHGLQRDGLRVCSRAARVEMVSDGIWRHQRRHAISGM